MVINNLSTTTTDSIRFYAKKLRLTWENQSQNVPSAKRGFLEYQPSMKRFQVYYIAASNTIPQQPAFGPQQLKKLKKRGNFNGLNYIITLEGEGFPREIQLSGMKPDEKEKLHQLILELVGVITAGSSIKDNVVNSSKRPTTNHEPNYSSNNERKLSTTTKNSIDFNDQHEDDDYCAILASNDNKRIRTMATNNNNENNKPSSSSSLIGSTPTFSTKKPTSFNLYRQQQKLETTPLMPISQQQQQKFSSFLPLKKNEKTTTLTTLTPLNQNKLENIKKESSLTDEDLRLFNSPTSNFKKPPTDLTPKTVEAKKFSKMTLATLTPNLPKRDYNSHLDQILSNRFKRKSEASFSSLSNDDVMMLDNDKAPKNDENAMTLKFCPVDNIWRKKWCHILEIYDEYIGDEEKPDKNPYVEFQLNWGRDFAATQYPQHKANVGGDGNCLFRAFSHYFTSGSQLAHMKIREKICDFLKEHEEIFARHCGKNATEFGDYVEGMRISGTWGTDVELLACATMLNTPIVTYFEGRWYTYLPRFGINENASLIRLSEIGTVKDVYDKFIYLINYSEHYSPVLSVI